METLGQWLRSHREGKPLSQEALATATRIPLAHIRAIEENRFDQLPHLVSAKGFLRLYARAVGLDEAKVIQRFEEVYTPPAQKENDGRPSNLTSYIQATETESLFSLWRVAGATGVVVMLLAGGAVLTGRLDLDGIFSSQRNEASPPTRDELPVRVEEAVMSAPTPVVLETPSAMRVEGTVESSPFDRRPATPVATASTVDASLPTDRPLVLAIEAREKTWVRVVIDGKETWDVMLKASEKIAWQAQEVFLLTIGNAGGVAVHFDGEELERLGPSGKVVRNLRLARKVSRPFFDVSSFRPA